MAKGLNFLDRTLLEIAPTVAAKRIQARNIAKVMQRHYEAASSSRRTSGWKKVGTDANSANGPALTVLRNVVRDLERNNPWSTKALRVIANNTVGWGITPKPTNGTDVAKKKAMELWTKWADTTQCDADGMLTFSAMQHRIIKAVARDGEVLIRRRPRRAEDNLAIPLQIQVLEIDFVDISKDGVIGVSGGPIIQGVEYDLLGKRAAYWIYTSHPGASYGVRGTSIESKRVPASEIQPIFRLDRFGQVHGISWGAPVVVSTKDFDEYEDATLLRQKIAACFTAFVTDIDGSGTGLGEVKGDQPTLDNLEPGLISYLTPGRDVKFAEPPTVSEFDPYSKSVLRKIAAGWGVTYEALTGDYSMVNYSSARMGRLEFIENVKDWRWNMLIPQLCSTVWAWAMEAALIAGQIRETPSAAWYPPPLAFLEPDKEGLAIQRNIRSGITTLSESLREQGLDPDEHFAEYAKDLEKLDKLGIILDSDARKTTQAGNPREIVQKANTSTK